MNLNNQYRSRLFAKIFSLIQTSLASTIYSLKKDEIGYKESLKLLNDSVDGIPSIIMNESYFVYFFYNERCDNRIDEIEDYFEKVTSHRKHVINAGLSLIKKPWFPTELRYEFISNLAIHDVSKFSTNEYFAYMDHDFTSGELSPEFELAWNHHKHNNKHHPEYWMSVSKSGNVHALDMPDVYILEMIADWIGAGKSYGSSLAEWAPKNVKRFLFSRTTAIKVRKYLFEASRMEGIKLDCDVFIRENGTYGVRLGGRIEESDLIIPPHGLNYIGLPDVKSLKSSVTIHGENTVKVFFDTQRSYYKNFDNNITIQFLPRSSVLNSESYCLVFLKEGKPVGFAAMSHDKLPEEAIRNFNSIFDRYQLKEELKYLGGSMEEVARYNGYSLEKYF